MKFSVTMASSTNWNSSCRDAAQLAYFTGRQAAQVKYFTGYPRQASLPWNLKHTVGGRGTSVPRTVLLSAVSFVVSLHRGRVPRPVLPGAVPSAVSLAQSALPLAARPIHPSNLPPLWSTMGPVGRR